MRNVLANWLWLLLFGALALGFIIGGLSASKEIPHQQHAQRPSAAQGGAESQSTAISEPHAEQSSAKAGDKKEPHGNTVFGWIANFFEVKLTDLLIAIFTVVLAVKTSGLFRETAGLRSAADRQALDMQASIKVAQDAANAAKRAADIAERAIVEGDRAWIAVKPEIIAPLVFEKDRIHIGVGVDMVNIGKSPATNVEVWAESALILLKPKARAKNGLMSPNTIWGTSELCCFPTNSAEKTAGN
jgi:hypothetical protein